MKQIYFGVAAGVLCAAIVVASGIGRVVAAPTTLPGAELDDTAASGQGRSSVVLAGGCFWGVEEVFQHVNGVVDAVSGYAGGDARTANYETVSSGTSGHAESVKVTYDPAKITLGQILQVFFSVAHDPTQLNRQGPDVGPQYRSAIFFANERQQRIAKAYVDQLEASRVFRRRIETELVPLKAFYEAEEHHQDFAAKNPYHRYILLVDKPKVDNLKKEFPSLYR
jgi:peptide-methionine (S)-S-oxide reductase